MEPHNPLLDTYILSQSKSSSPKICFIGTASGDAESYIDKFYKSFGSRKCIPSHLSLFKGNIHDMANHISQQDIIFVGGGNTRNLLTLWRDWGLDEILRRAYERGVIMSGISAGSICWFAEGVTDSVPGALTSLPCLGWLPESNCVHYDGEKERRPRYHQLLRENRISPGIAADDGVALHYVDEQLHSCVSSHPEKRAYRLSKSGEEISEEVIIPRYLGGHGIFVRRAAEADIEGIHNAHMKSIQEVCSRDHTPEEIKGWGHRPFRPGERLQALKQHQHYVWVVECDGQIEGYAYFQVLQHPPKPASALSMDGARIEVPRATGHLLGLYLTPKILGKGFGKALFEEVLLAAKDENVRFISLESTLTAQGFYSSRGFRATESIVTVKIGGSDVRCQPMRMEL